jgi:hypothetical protein
MAVCCQKVSHSDMVRGMFFYQTPASEMRIIIQVSSSPLMGEFICDRVDLCKDGWVGQMF